METFISFVTLAGMAYGAYRAVKWMMRAGSFQPKREQPLTPNDLKVLEESASRLIADLRAAADECVAKVERALSEAEVRLERAPNLDISTNGGQYSQVGVPVSEGNGTPEPMAVLARQSGMTTGEVELIRNLRRIGG